MDMHDLYYYCRVGDLFRIKNLVEQKEVDLNIRDRWDSTPLYYACLCGHIEVVKYLLENGAKCEANTFDGERCLYGALSPNIRSILRNYKVVSSNVIRRELYAEFLRKLFESGEYADLCFVVHGRKFFVHRCVLSVRSDYLFDLLLDKWRDRDIVHIKHKLVNPDAFAAFLQFLYEGRLEIHVDLIDDLLRLARHCKAESLARRIEQTAKKTQSFECTKPGTKVTILVVEVENDNVEVSSDFTILAEEALPVSMRHWIGANELPFYRDEIAPFADVIFQVHDQRFMCHKAFFCLRSEYFRTMLMDSFCEDQRYNRRGNFSDLSSFLPDSRDDLPIFALKNTSVVVFVCILYYVYSDYAKLTVNDVYDVLLAADLYLLPGLKRQCGAFMAKFLDLTNVCSTLRTARLFQLPKLEDQCYQFMAENLEMMIEIDEFHELIRSDAFAVQKRQDVDSIDVIDNVRFHLTSNSMYEAEDKLTLISSLLEQLDLDA